MARGQQEIARFPGILAHPLARTALAVGLIERIARGVVRRIPHATGEAENVAVALANGRGFADPFLPGQGPTAHLLPGSPLVGGVIYRLFGVQSLTSEIVLFTLCVATVFAVFVMFARCFERIGSPRMAVLGGFAALCLLPIYTTIETFDFRVWEGAYGLALGAMALLVILAVDAGSPPRYARLGLAVLPAAAFFVSPPVGLGAYAALLLLLWRRRDVLPPLPVLGAAALVLATMLGSWAVRNAVVMHQPILLRDNVGLELAVANFPGALAPGDFDEIFYRHLDAIHPRDQPAVFRAMVAVGGEAAYSRLMGTRARAWIAAHPGETATLWLRHVREMLFTRTWMFETTNAVWLPLIRASLVSIIGALGIAGILRHVRDGSSGRYAALFVALPVLCYIPFQPIVRYSWLVYPPLTYFAADCLARMASAWRGRRLRSALPVG